MSQNNPPILHVGLDVAKLSLALHLAGKNHSLDNDAKGHVQLLKLLRPQPAAHVVCETTGGYEQKVVRALQAALVHVSIVEKVKYRLLSYTRWHLCIEFPFRRWSIRKSPYA